jgi:RNA polymerase sigma-70 factor (ECF subfamily)
VLWGVVCLRLGSSSGGNLTEFLYLQHLQQATGGDASAVEVVVQKLQSRIAGMAAHYARCSGEDADDLRQEAWLGLLEALPNLDLHIGDPEQYLVRYARWRLLDAVRRARLRRCDSLNNWLEAHRAMTSHKKPCSTGLAFVSQRIAAGSIWRRTRSKPFLWRNFAASCRSLTRIVLNCLMRGLTWRETASVLGCTSANVAYHVRQIRRLYQTWNDGAISHAAV